MFDKEYFLDSQYKIIEELGAGLSSKIYLVEDIENCNRYLCKIYSTEKLFVKEYNNYKNFICKSQSDFLIRFISSNGISKNNVYNYIIFEYAEKGGLINYLENGLGGFDEIYCKLIFEQMLNGIKDLHDTGLTHNYLTLKNILLGKNYSIKISNFIYSDNKSGDKYKDLFCLFAILLELLTGKKIDLLKLYECYKKNFLTRLNKIFWDVIKINTKINFSENFIKLIDNMLSIKSLYTIEEILKSDWMSEINVGDKTKEILEQKLIEEFKKREEKINDMRKKSDSIMETEYGYDIHDIDCRGLQIEENIFTLSRHNAKKTKSNFPLNNIMKINLSTDPYKLMNQLYKNIEKHFDDCVSFELDEGSTALKFRVTIDKKIELDNELTEKINQLILEEKKDTEQKDEINIYEEDDDENQCIIDIELFKYENNKNDCYLLRFVRKSSNISQYNEYLKIIKSLIKIKNN